MTTKEIAQAVGKDETAVRRWARKLAGDSPVIAGKIADSTSAHPADYSLEETCMIIESGLGKNAADLFRMSASAKTNTPIQESTFITRSDLAEFGRALVSEMMKQVIPLIQGNKTDQLQIGEAPGLSLRDQLRKIVDEAARESGDYAGTYNRLYNEIRYRLHINVAERARNAGVSKIEILDAEGHLMSAILIAREIFK